MTKYYLAELPDNRIYQYLMNSISLFFKIYLALGNTIRTLVAAFMVNAARTSQHKCS
ncbi:MAG: hypothetical protein V7K67_32170 [Nostoc sp.]